MAVSRADGPSQTRTLVSKRPFPRIRGTTITTYLSLILYLVIVLVPFYWMVRSTLSVPAQLFTRPPVYLPDASLANFARLADQVPLFSYARNSLIFATLTAISSVTVSFLAAYAFARIAVPGKSLILWGFMLSVALPEISTVIPLFQTLRTLGLLDSVLGLTLVMSSTLTPFTVWILIAFIQQIPYEIEEAAIIDGANLYRKFRHILIPVTAPAIVTMLIINFINAWNNLLYPLVFSVSPRSKTLSVAITELFAARGPYGLPWELIMTLGVVMVVPVTIIVLVSQKAIVRGLTRGAIK